MPIEAAIGVVLDPRLDLEITLVGDESRLRPLLGRRNVPLHRLRVHHAPEVVSMEDAPSVVLRKKRQSSIRLGMELQREGAVDAFVSAGNTGAVMAAALSTLGRIENISRPAIVTIFPTKKEPCLLLDVGANVDCKPRHLAQFAVMGHIYARDVLGREEPRIGLLSIGEERGKGNEVTVAAYRLLEESGLNFIGNVEGGDVLKGPADVIVSDGFVGNVVLKFGESFLDFLMEGVKEQIRSSVVGRLGAMLMRPALHAVRKRIDYQEYGGAPLLGVDGIVVIGHGGSSVKAYGNAIRVARLAVERKLNRHIEDAVRDFDFASQGEGRVTVKLEEQAARR